MKFIEKQVKDIYTKSQLPAADIVVNPYIGCTHNCIYCYASFMQRFVNIDEPYGSYIVIKEWQRKHLNKLSNKTILFSSITDPFQPINERYNNTQKALQEIIDAKIDCHVEILTKSKFVLHALDQLKEIPNLKVGISISTIDDRVSRMIEPGASVTSERIETLKILHVNNIPCYAFISPIIPYVTDVYALIEAVKDDVDYICFENLNLRSSYKQEVFHFIEKQYPTIYEDFKKVYTDKAYAERYWQTVEEDIQQYCADRNIEYRLFFYHSKIRKNK